MENHKKINFLDNLNIIKVIYRYGKNLNTFSSEGCIVSYERDKYKVPIAFTGGEVKGYQVWNLTFKETKFQEVYRMINLTLLTCEIEHSEIIECNFHECIIKSCTIKDSYIEVGNTFINCYFYDCWGPGLDQTENLIDCNLIIH